MLLLLFLFMQLLIFIHWKSCKLRSSCGFNLHADFCASDQKTCHCILHAKAHFERVLHLITAPVLNASVLTATQKNH